jgi:hypothetical protein
MGKGRDKRRRKAKKSETTKSAPRVVVELPSTDPPPILGEPDAPVPAPLRPKPHVRSGAVAVPEPAPEDEFEVVHPRAVSEKTGCA